MDPDIQPQGDVSLIASVLATRQKWQDQFIQVTSRNPFESLMVMILAGSIIFHKAELGKNPKVITFWDALNFISTCASVGYSDIFAKTSTGRIVSSIVMTFGPALCAKVFDQPAAGSEAQQPVIERLDAILAELRRIREST